MISPLFSTCDVKIETEIQEIIKLIKSKYDKYFGLRICKDKFTKRYLSVCDSIRDIYNGTFIRNRVLSDEFKKRLRDNNYRDTLDEVKYSYNKVKQLIFTALKNYELMFDKNRTPYKKKYLFISLDKFFYDEINLSSLFIQCFNEPEYLYTYIYKMKADEIYNSFNTDVKKWIDELYSMNNTISYYAFICKIKGILEFSELLYEYESDKSYNICYFLAEPDDILSSFIDYIKTNNINIYLNTFDISIDSNSTFRKFIIYAISKYNLNKKLSLCATKDDFQKYYK